MKQRMAECAAHLEAVQPEALSGTPSSEGQRPLTLLEAVRQVGDEVMSDAFQRAKEREALRRQGKEPPPLFPEQPPEE